MKRTRRTPAAGHEKGSPRKPVRRAWHDDPVGFAIVGLGMGQENAKNVVASSGCRLVGGAGVVIPAT